jgi:hypothetical protein
MSMRFGGLCRDSIADFGCEPNVENVAHQFLETVDVELFESRLRSIPPSVEAPSDCAGKWLA